MTWFRVDSSGDAVTVAPVRVGSQPRRRHRARARACAIIGSLAVLLVSCTSASTPPSASGGVTVGASQPVSAACSVQPKVGGTVRVINDGGGTNPITES